MGDSEFQKPITGTITGVSQSLDLGSPNSSVQIVQISGTWIGTLIIEGSNDNVTYTSLSSINHSTKLLISSITSNGVYVSNSNGFQYLRIRSSIWSSGTASIFVFGSDAASLIDTFSTLRGGTDGTIVGNIDDNLKVISPNIGTNDGTATSKSNLIAGRYPAGGTMVPVQVDEQGRLVTSAITGFGANFSFGDVATSVILKTAVRRTSYTEQTTNAKRSIASANANDTAAGTGARTVLIIYYDQAGAGPYTETITLNGTSYVNTVNTNICFIEKIEVVTAGTGGVNAGIITLKAATAGGGATIGTIGAGDNQTFWAHHYIPTGKTANITGISCGHNGTTVGSGALFILATKPIGVANAIEKQVSDFVRLYGQSSTFARSYVSPIKIVGPARLVIYVTPETSSATTYRCSMDYFEP